MIDKEKILTTFTANVKSEKLGEFLDELDKVVLEGLSKSFEEEGHTMTGKLISDIGTDVEVSPGKLVIDYLGYKYGAYLNSGVKADKIPYTRGSHAGKSLYISGLMRYVKQRMNVADLKKQKSIAFAIATEQKKHGMPLRTLGQGTKWADKVPAQIEDQVAELFAGLNETYIFESLTQVFQKYGSNN